MSRQVTVFDVRDPAEPRATAIVGDLRIRSQVEAAVQGAFAVAVLHPVAVPYLASWVECMTRGAYRSICIKVMVAARLTSRHALHACFLRILFMLAAVATTI